MGETVKRAKLGLALAGGGFRASLFHVGVFRRLADLDLLRYVEVISAVSGGSIVATLYALLLKREFEKPQFNGRLSAGQYKFIANDLESRLCTGIQKNLRARLFMNPFNICRGFTSGDHLSRIMARLYERCIFQETIDELTGIDHKHDLIFLRDIKINPGGKELHLEDIGDIDSYNQGQVQQRGSVLTKLILNATSLNSGSRFWFSGSEVGEWDYGYLHEGDVTDIKTLKTRINQAYQKIGLSNAAGVDRAYQLGDSIGWCFTGGSLEQLPKRWQRLLESWQGHFPRLDSGSDSLHALLNCKLGLLRLARRAAWYLRPPKDLVGVSAGLSATQHSQVLAEKLGAICHQYADQVGSWLVRLKNASLLDDLYDFVNDVYLVRSADSLDASAGEYQAEFPLCHAVAASANFPPVFAPFQITQLYDDLHVSRLGLTDGGVYDNLGVVGLLDEDCNYVISSDTGQLAGPERWVSTGRIGMVPRIASILMDDDARQTREMLLERHRVSAGLGRLACELSATGHAAKALNELHSTRELLGLAAFRIDSPEVCEREKGDSTRVYSAAELAKVRTDLDAFGDIEINALVGQGYINSGIFLKRWFDFDPNEKIPSHLYCHYRDNSQDYPYGSASQGDDRAPEFARCRRQVSKRRIEQTLKAARSSLPHVFYIGCSIWCWLAWITLLALCAVVLWGLGMFKVDIIQALSSLLTRVLFLEELGLGGEITWRRLIVSLAIIALVYYLAGKFVNLWFNVLKHQRRAGRVGLARKMALVARYPRLLRAFVSTLVLRAFTMLPMWLVYFYSRLYLLATNLGPYGRSCHRSEKRQSAVKSGD